MPCLPRAAKPNRICGRSLTVARQDLLHKTAPIVSVEPPINFASRFDGIADLQQARALQRGRLMAVVAAVLAASLTVYCSTH